MKVSARVAAAIKEISEIQEEIRKSARGEILLAPIKYSFFFDRVACDYDDIAKAFMHYKGIVENNKSAYFVTQQIEAEKIGAKFEKGIAEIKASGMVAEERITRNHFEAAMNGADKLLQALNKHLDIIKHTPGSTF